MYTQNDQCFNAAVKNTGGTYFEAKPAALAYEVKTVDFAKYGVRTITGCPLTCVGVPQDGKTHSNIAFDSASQKFIIDLKGDKLSWEYKWKASCKTKTGSAVVGDEITTTFRGYCSQFSKVPSIVVATGPKYYTSFDASYDASKTDVEFKTGIKALDMATCKTSCELE